MHINMFLNFHGIYLQDTISHILDVILILSFRTAVVFYVFLQTKHVCVLNLELPVPIMLRNIIFWKFLKITSLVRRYFSENAL